jgi:hypothetical protein
LLEAMAGSIGARVYTHAHYSRCRFLHHVKNISPHILLAAIAQTMNRIQALAKAQKIERFLGSPFTVSVRGLGNCLRSLL